MDRTQQRCLAGSTVAHVGVLAAVLVASTIAARQAVPPDVPFLEIIPTDLALTMGTHIGGGSVNPLPPAAKEFPAPPPKAAVPEVVKPPSAPKPEVKPEPKPVDPPKPKPADRKLELPREPRPSASAQDVDPTRKADKPVPATTPRVQVSDRLRTRTNADKQAEREARDAATSEAEARERRLASARNLVSRLSGAAAGVSQNLGGSTKIEMPGPGGRAYAPYFAWLKTFLYERWVRPPTSSHEQPWVEIEVVIARDGTVLSATITRPSGLRSLDASVETIFRQYRKLRPLPDDYKEPRLVVPVKFVLEASEAQ